MVNPFERMMCALGLYLEALHGHNIDTGDGNSQPCTQNGSQSLFSKVSTQHDIHSQKKSQINSMTSICIFDI